MIYLQRITGESLFSSFLFCNSQQSVKEFHNIKIQVIKALLTLMKKSDSNLASIQLNEAANLIKSNSIPQSQSKYDDGDGGADVKNVVTAGKKEELQRSLLLVLIFCLRPHPLSRIPSFSFSTFLFFIPFLSFSVSVVYSVFFLLSNAHRLSDGIHLQSAAVGAVTLQVLRDHRHQISRCHQTRSEDQFCFSPCNKVINVHNKGRSILGTILYLFFFYSSSIFFYRVCFLFCPGFGD